MKKIVVLVLAFGLLVAPAAVAEALTTASADSSVQAQKKPSTSKSKTSTSQSKTSKSKSKTSTSKSKTSTSKTKTSTSKTKTSTTKTKTTTKTTATKGKTMAPAAVKAKAKSKAKKMKSTDRTELLRLLNRGSSNELQTLPGVGPSTAANIKAARPFNEVADLVDVTGIGEAKYNKIIDHAMD